MLKVREIADKYSVAPLTVYRWMNQGLPYKTINEIGRKPYRVIDPEDVLKFRGVAKES